MKCKYCSKIGKNAGGLAAHEKHCKDNPNRVPFKRSPNAGRKKGCTAWNKGKSYEETYGIEKAEEIRVKASNALKGRGHPHSDETKRRLSKIAKLRNFGGYQQGSGRGKKGWYKGFFCDSSWELAFLVYCLDHNIPIERNKEKRSYLWKGKTYNYIPDFIVDGSIVEIKGYKSNKWLAKHECNSDIKVYYEEDMKKYFNYVHNEYGKDFINLYEER